MADFQGIVTTPGANWLTAEYRGSQVSAFNNYQIASWWRTLPVPGATVFYIYKMRGMDALVVLYDTWLVQGEPDSTGSKYTGALAKPLRDIIVTDKWLLSN